MVPKTQLYTRKCEFVVKQIFWPFVKQKKDRVKMIYTDRSSICMEGKMIER